MEGKTLYQILVLGHSSFLSRRCVEDLLIHAANEHGFGLIFDDSEDCDLCVIVSDGLLGYAQRSLCECIEAIRSPVVAFGIGTEGPFDEGDHSDMARLSRTLKRIALFGVRGTMTAQALRNLGATAPIMMIGDPIMNFRLLKLDPPAPLPHVGLNVIRFPGCERRERTFLENMAGGIARFLALRGENDGCRIICLDYDRTSGDMQQAMRLKQMLDCGQSVCILPDLKDLFLSYSRLQYVHTLIGMRSNAALIAAINGICPLVLEHRGQRAVEMMSLIDCTDHVLSPYEIDGEMLYERACALQRTWDTKKNPIKEQVVQWRNCQRAFADRVIRQFLP